MNFFDTIAAVSTPLGKGGVALVRISGEGARSVAAKIFKAYKNTPRGDEGAVVGEADHAAPSMAPQELTPRHAYYGEIVFPTTGAHIDDGIATFFAAPNSFTGEDTVEICCHGGIFVTSKVLAASLAAGARQAEGGEFTRRAFVNGKMKLSEAEALSLVLDAKNDAQLSAASGNMRGALAKEITALCDEISLVLSSVYAKIDFPDEDLAGLDRDECRERLEKILEKIEKLQNTYTTGKAISEGIPTVICGAANTGKSTLFNLLSRSDDAIVTDVAGTTRDVLRSEITLGKVTLLLSDTAGFRGDGEKVDKIEAIGIERAKREMQGAGLILAVFDLSSDGEKEISDAEALCAEIAELESFGSAKAIAILNKSDAAKEKSKLEQFITEKFGESMTVKMSARTGEGEEKLRELIESLYIDGKIELGRDALVLGSRQYASLSSAAEAIRSAVESIASGAPEDMYCHDAEAALSSLGEIDGREVSEKIVAGIFSHFCVGK